jgi:hypothetical protein
MSAAWSIDQIGAENVPHIDRSLCRGLLAYRLQGTSVDQLEFVAKQRRATSAGKRLLCCMQTFIL